MGRPRKFDETEALEQAMAVFWTNGYQRTTPQKLLDAMGLSKSSLYETFGSKRELFLRCLQYYHRTKLEQLKQLLAHDHLHTALGNIYDLMIEMATTEDQRCGCFATNTAAELSPHDKEVEQIIQGGIAEARAAYCQRLLQAQATGEISAHHDPQALADYLLTCNAGLQVMAKANPDPQMLRKVVEVTLSVLR